MFGQLPILFQHREATKATDAMRQVDDQVAHLQIRKRIDGLAQPSATLSAKVGAAENLVATDDGLRSDGATDAEALVDTAKPDLDTRGFIGAKDLGDA